MNTHMYINTIYIHTHVYIILEYYIALKIRKPYHL